MSNRPPSRRSPLVIESLEPRLLLSAGPVSQAALQAMHDNLLNLETVLKGLESVGNLGHDAPLISANGSTTAGGITQIHQAFDNDIIGAIQAELSSPSLSTDLASSTALASALQTQIQSLVGTTGGHSATVTDHSAGNTISFSFAVTDSTTTGFNFDLGATGTALGLHVPDGSGNSLLLTYGMNFTTAVDQSALGANPTASQSAGAFTLSAASFTTGFHATGDLSGKEFDVGILALTVDPATSVPIDVAAAYSGSIASATGTVLSADAGAITGGDSTSLTGATPLITMGITSQTDGSGGTPLLDIPLLLTEAHTIPGIDPITTDVHLTVTGHEAGADSVVNVAALTTALQTATHNPTLDIASLNTFLPGDLTAELSKLSDYIDKLSIGSGLDIAIPFTNGTTIGSVIDVASAFNDLLIKPLETTVGVLGFTEAQHNATGANFIEGTALTPAQLEALPSSISIQLQLDNGKVTALHFAPTYLDSNNVAQPIATVDNLISALNQALLASPLAGYVLAANDSGRVEFQLTTPPSGSSPATAANTITVTSPSGSSLFSNIRDFGIQLAKLLQLPGYDDTTTPADTLGTQLLTELGLGYDATTNAITLSISHEFDLPSLSTSFALNLDLGSVANLSISNATLNVVPSVLLNLTVGFSLNPLGSDVNQPGGPVIGDGTNGTTDVTLSSIPVVAQASSGGTIPLTADAIAGVSSGLADLQIIGREGAVATIEINPNWTLSNLETAIASAFNFNQLQVSYNLSGNSEIDITDTYAPYSGPSPAAVGLQASQQAQAVHVGTDPTDYQAVLGGIAVATPDWGTETKFILTIGKLAPVVVDVAAGASSAASFATAINTALAGISVDATQLGLSSSVHLHYSDLVRAATDSSGGIALTTTIYQAITGDLGGSPQLSAQRTAIQWGVRVDPVDLTISALNGSLLPGVLGIVGRDINAAGSATSEIVGSALHGETLADRLLLENTGISATIDVSLVPTDDTQPVTISGALGPLGFTAPLDPDNVYVSIKASLLLSDDANAVPDVVTLHQLTDSIAQGTFSSLWSFSLSSGRDGQPFAKIDITGVDLTVGSVDLAAAAQPEIIITLDDPGVLLDGSLPKPHVDVEGFSPTLAAADVVAAIQQTFEQLDSGLANATIPLINVSVDQILGLATNFLTALDAAEADPAGTLTAIQTDINTALGGDYVTLSQDAQHNIIFHIQYQPLAVSTTLPFNLNLSDLTSFLGSDGGALASLASVIDGIASASASGSLDVTAGVSLALTLGINLGANDSPAALTDLLSTLNSGKGLRTGTTGQPDLQVTLGNGKSFSVSVASLGSTATVQNLLDLLNTQAAADGATDFATYDATTGVITLTDNTTSSSAGLAPLGLSGVTGTDTGTSYKLIGDTALTAANAGKAYSFEVAIGAGVTTEVDVAADASRTTVASLVSAIRAAINDATVSATALAHENVVLPGSGGTAPAKDYAISLGQIVSVTTNSAGDLVLSAKDSVLGTDGHGNLLNILAVHDVTPTLGFSVTSLNGSHVAQDLGLGSDAASISNSDATRVLTGTLREPDSFSNRFFLETGTDGSGNLLTGVDATVGVSATNLNFTAGIGAFSGTVVNGTAAFGLDTGKVAAGSDGFAVGDATTAPATFEISLNDGFGGATAGGGILTFANLAKLGTTGNSLSDLVKFVADAAVNIDLPVTVFDQNLGSITLQIGNLFDTTEVDGLPARTVSTSFPSFSNISVGSILNDPQTIIDGLDAFLSTLSGGPFASTIYSLNLPLIGPALRDIGSFFSTLHDDVIGTLQSLLDSFKAAHPGQPATTQNIVTAGLNEVLALLHIPGQIYSYIDDINNPTELSFVWHFDATLLNATVNLSTDLGIPGLGLSIQNGQANVQADLDATIGFGYLKGKGFFVYDMGVPGALASFTSNNDPNNVYTADFQTTHALDLGIVVSLANNFSASINLGFLTAQATNGSLLTATSLGQTITGTSLSGDLYADIGTTNVGGRLLFSQFASQQVLRAYVDTTLNVDLMIDAGFGFGSVSVALPSVSTELLFSYAYAKALVGTLPDGVATGVTTPLTFKDVSLDIGSFLTQFLKPILDDLSQVTGPIQPFLDFLTSPIPGISQIIGPTSVLDIAQQIGVPGIQDAVKFIKILDEITTFVNTLEAVANANPGHILLDFGTYVLGATSDPNAHSVSGTTVDPFASKTAVSGANISAAVSSLAGAGASAAADALNRVSSASGTNVGSQLSTLQSSTGAGGKPVIDFPILHDPMSVIELLMGQSSAIDLIHVTLPTFNFSLSKDLAFHFLIGPVPVVVDFYASVSVQINLAFGYDTSGITRFLSDHNPLDILDGFYVDDTLGPQLTFSATFGVQAGVDLELVAAGLGGQITGTISFQLHDPSGTGKIHASVLLMELEDNPLHMFDIAGALTAKIYAWFWVGIEIPFVGKITLYQGQFTILDVTLLSFSYSYADAHSTPQLAHQVGSTASLNLGNNADQQEVGGNLYNPNQNFTITGTGGDGANASESVNISGSNTTTSYSGLNKITADVGQGNNTITFVNVNSDVTITGGDGNNTLDLSGVSADPVIMLGDGNNVIYGAQTDTTIVLGNGRNTIYGGTGRMTIVAGDGSNTIVGGSGDDVITVGLGNNTIWGGAGDDTITAGGGNNTIWGGDGADVITIQHGAGNNIIFGNGPNSPTAPSTTTITATQISDDAISNTDAGNVIQGGNGSDIIFGGGGSNTISGGAGGDILFGSTGTVSLDGHGGVVQMVANATIGGANTITGGAGDSVIFGGIGANTITSGSSNDIVVGNLGTVDGAAGGSAGHYTISATVGVGGKDVITLGVGTDVVVAGHGANTIHAGAGNDIIVAHEGTVVRDAASGRTAKLVSVMTTDEVFGGNALVDSGTGNDFILGGAGNNVIHAGTSDGSDHYTGAGFDVILGNFGTILASPPGPSQITVYQQLTVTGVDGAASGTGNNTITTDNTAVIMGGGGNNTIITSEGTLSQEIVFGANGQVLVDSLLAGGIRLHTAQTLNGEEKIGGSNVITVGEGADVVFGGAGNATITAGNGSDVILGHIGVVNDDRLANPDHTGLTPDIIGYLRAQDGSTLATTGATITAGNGQDVILGGAGNNTITAGTGNDIVFGAAGMITRDGLAGNALIMAQTTEESLAGNNTITVGVGGIGNNVIFGGIGHNTITAGDGNNVILGHLGVVNYTNLTNYTAAQRADGSRPDVLGRYLPEIGSQVMGAPTTPGLDSVPVGGGSVIVSGNGNNVIVGGAGNNTITAGYGNNVVFGAAGTVTRDSATLALVFASTTEEQYGGNNIVTVGNGNNDVFGGIGNNFITAGDRSNVLFGHLGQVNYAVQSLYTAAQRATGALPDVVGRTLPEIGNRSPNTTTGNLGLDQPVTGTTSTIYAGNGSNVIMGGAGNNTIIAGLGLNVIFGASGAVTRSPVTESLVYATTVEEAAGGNNLIIAGLRGLVGDIVFGGIGSNVISLGGGNNVVLGHLGVVNITAMTGYTAAQRADGSHPDIYSRTVPEIGNVAPVTPGATVGLNTAAVTGNDTITAGNGNNIIMGGGGNNTITAGGGTNVVFGASGAVTRDARTRAVVIAQTVEESLGGNDTITVGVGARNATNTVFGGAGTNIITLGGGNDVVLAHLGTVNVTSITGQTALTDAQRADGSHPDIVGRTIPVYGNVSPANGRAFGGLGQPLPVGGSTIVAGNGNDIIIGGAGDNTITAGNGNNVIFGASGAVTRSANASLGVLVATTVENAVGGTNIINVGTGVNTVFGGAGDNTLSTVGTTDMLFGHTGEVFLVAGNQTLASGQGLAALAVAAQARAGALPVAVSPASSAVRPGGTTFILDSTHGYWIADEADTTGPLLILDGVDAPELVLDVTTPIAVTGTISVGPAAQAA